MIDKFLYAINLLKEISATEKLNASHPALSSKIACFIAFHGDEEAPKTGVDAAIQKLIERATVGITKDGYFTVSTCDHHNWDMNEHVAMQRLHRNPPKGLHISYKVSFGVMDWTITKP